MTKPISATFLISINRPGLVFQTPAAQWRRTMKWELFASELARHLGTPVPVVDGLLPEAPERGFVIADVFAEPDVAFADCTPEQLAALKPRLVLLQADEHTALALLETHRLAAAIDSLSWIARWYPAGGWEDKPRESWHAGNIFGRCELPPKFGIECCDPGPGPGLFRSAHYCAFGSFKQHQGLPHLLADYLRAYAAEYDVPL